MADEVAELEHRIDELRETVRRAALAGDRARARELRSELGRVQHEWDSAMDRLALSAVPEPGPTGAAGVATATEDGTAVGGSAAREGAAAGRSAQLLPIREQVHEVLTLLGVPAGQRLVVTVHDGLFGGRIPAARLTSIRRDEERSFRASPRARPYYLCSALTADLLAPARGMLAVSTWPMSRRVIGPLSPRVNYLTAAIRVAESLQRAPRPWQAAHRLLWRFAVNIPGAGGGQPHGTTRGADPELVARAARAELEVHAEADAAHREATAARARAQLGEAEQLFGSKLRVAGRAGTAS
jgi:hypothetical protein